MMLFAWTALSLGLCMPPPQAGVTLEDLEDPSAELRIEALRRLRGADFDSSPLAIERLRALLEHQDSEQRVEAAYALGRFDERAWPALQWALENGDGELRCAAAESIEKAFDAARMIRSDLWIARRSAGRQRFALWARGLVESLAEALADPEERVRYFAALALYKLGDSAVRAAPALRVARDDDSAGVRLFASATLELLDQTPGKTVREVLATLGPDTTTPLEDCPRLADLATPAQYDPWATVGDQVATHGATPAHAALLRWVRVRGPEVLARAAKRDFSSLAEFRAWHAAREDLERADRLLELEIDRLLVCQRAERWQVDGEGARALVALGPAALPQLQLEFLRVPQFPRGDWTPLKVAWMLEPQGARSLPTWILGLEHIYAGVREQSVRSLAKLGEGAAPAMIALSSAWRARVGD